MGLGLEVAKDGLKTPACCQKIQQKSKTEQCLNIHKYSKKKKKD